MRCLSRLNPLLGGAILIASVLPFVATAQVDATTEPERQYLVRLVAQLDEIQRLASRAADNADPYARVTLDYVALQKDLTEIRRAIQQHVTQPERSPRRLPALELAASK